MKLKTVKLTDAEIAIIIDALEDKEYKLDAFSDKRKAQGNEEKSQFFADKAYNCFLIQSKLHHTI